jgi:hypothetical protein
VVLSLLLNSWTSVLACVTMSFRWWSLVILTVAEARQVGRSFPQAYAWFCTSCMFCLLFFSAQAVWGVISTP